MTSKSYFCIHMNVTFETRKFS